jgi:hypothetical protein
MIFFYIYRLTIESPEIRTPSFTQKLLFYAFKIFIVIENWRPILK